MKMGKYVEFFDWKAKISYAWHSCDIFWKKWPYMVSIIKYKNVKGILYLVNCVHMNIQGKMS